jgi:hypothetical protein
MAENAPFGGFNSGPHCQDHPAVIRGNLDSGGSAAIFTGLEFTALFYLALFASSGTVAPHANLTILTPSIATEGDRLAAEYICKTCWPFYRHHKPLLRKMKFK